MLYLIDTDICIYLLNRRPREVIKRFKNTTIGEIGISSITVAELQYGVSKSQHKTENQQRLDHFLAPFDILSFGEKATRCYGELRSKLESSGKVIGPLDMLIAAHALSEELTIVTNNDKEFKRINRLKVENWVQ